MSPVPSCLACYCRYY